MSTDGVSNHEVQTREKFDKWSASLTYQSLRTWLGFLQFQVLKRVAWAEVDSLLDIACGGGWAVNEAARRLQDKQGSAFGCDISEGMLHKTIGSRPDLSNAHFIAASAQSLPYRDGSFDVAMCTAAFHHFPDPGAALQEVRRVLRPQGRLFIADPCRDQSAGTWVWDRLHRWFEKGHVKYYRTDELLDLLHGAGFDGIELEELAPTYAETKKLVRKAGIFSAVEPG